jgi:hypothetical protein
MIQYETKNPLDAARQEIFINKNTGILSYKNELGIVYTLLRVGDITPSETPTLQQVSDTGGLDDGSNIQQGNVERFGLTGISRVCSQGFEIQFVNGVEYYLTETGGRIWQAISSNGTIPDNTHDETQGFKVSSIYNDLKSNISYICTDATEENAVWLPMAGEYTPTLDGESGAASNVESITAFYTINNGYVDVTIYGNIDLDFSSSNFGSIDFTLPIPSISNNILGSVSVAIEEQLNGIVKNQIVFNSNDSTLIRTVVPFVAKFTYQAY